MPYARVILGPRYAVRLEQLLGSDAVDATCMLCRRSWLIAPHRLHERFLPHQRMVDIGKAMRCTECGSGHAMVWHVVRASPAQSKGP
ncbi:MAG: hypothetical protein H0T41_03070 [Rhodobacteraceae bacterium]|nr:hypothetical protein [Paracoccaceae bacterium]